VECWPLLRFVDGVGRCRLSALLPKPSTIEAARSAPQAAYFVPARDVSLGRGAWRADAS